MVSMQGTVMYPLGTTPPKMPNTVPHPIMHLLMQGAIDRIMQAKESIVAEKFSKKSEFINKSIGIITGLRVTLAHNSSMKIVNQFDEFYEVIVRNLSLANKENNLFYLDEVIQLMKKIKSNWEKVSQC